jgi:hypothetical protein
LSVSAVAQTDSHVAAQASTEAAPTRVEIVETGAGADLITFFRNGLPEVSILRDTLGDASIGAHQFRQVWDFSYVRPAWRQRVAAAIPFFYHRAGRNTGSVRSVPDALFDLSNPLKGTWGNVAESIAQLDVLDSRGALVRAPTRSYRGNSLDYRNMHLARSLEVVENGTYGQALPGDWFDEDWDEVCGRLFLGERLLGGFVSAERAEKVAAHELTSSQEDRASNWDLLRQSAEENGLYVEAMDSDHGVPHEAMLWFAQTAATPAEHKTAGTFLGISDPWRDARLRSWRGYTQSWFLNGDGVRVEAGQAGATLTRMIPLALYSLDYPRVPLLLIDFRSERARRREVARRAAVDVTTGVFGITPYGSLSWFTARTTYQFVRDRQGAALNRSDRLAAYARTRQMLLETNETMDRGLHKLLESKLDEIALSPYEQGSAGELMLIRRQYAALMRWAQDPNGLPKELDQARAHEYFVETHSPAQLAFYRTLQIASFGLWRPSHTMNEETLAELDWDRLQHSGARSQKQEAALPSIARPEAPPAANRDSVASVAGAGQ